MGHLLASSATRDRLDANNVIKAHQSVFSGALADIGTRGLPGP